MDVAGFGMGVAVGDVSMRQSARSFLTQYGGNRLFLNRGHGKFERSRLRPGAVPAVGTSAAFFDFDRDGWPDLVVVNYVD